VNVALAFAVVACTAPSQRESGDGIREVAGAADQICASPADVANTCPGDSGSGLIVDDELVGITSGGAGCGAHDPGWYVAAEPYAGWLEGTPEVAERGLNATRRP
jgi:hypothetical protein